MSTKGGYLPETSEEHYFRLFLIREIFGLTNMIMYEGGQSGKGIQFFIMVPFRAGQGNCNNFAELWKQ